MAIFSQLKYNNYVPQYVGAPLDEYLAASTAVQDRYNKVQEGYSLLGELADTIQTSPLQGDTEAKNRLLTQVNRSIEEAAAKGDFDQMQNQMRALAKNYSKQAAPIKENLGRYQAAEKAIGESKLPQQTQKYLLSNLRSKPGLSYDEIGNPQYLQADPFAENVDLNELYDKFIKDYKSDKAPGGIYAKKDPASGLVEYYSQTTNERVDPQDVQKGLLTVAFQDPKSRSFILQEAAANGQPIESADDFMNFSLPLINAYADKAGFIKEDVDWKLGSADSFKAKKKEDDLGEFTFDVNWGIPSRDGVASPSDLRNTRATLTEQRASVNDEFGKFLMNNGDPIDPMTGISKSGVDFSEEVKLYNDKLDGVDAQKWELDEVEQQAKKDAGLPSNYTPNQKVLDAAQQAYNDTLGRLRYETGRDGKPLYSEEVAKYEAQKAYTKSIEESNDPSLKAYRIALSKNAKDRTDVKGVTTFGKGTRAEIDEIGQRILAGEVGFVKATDISTGREITDLTQLGNAVESLGWTVDQGNVELIYRTGTMDKGKFVPSNTKVSIQGPPELTRQLTEKGYVDASDLEISKQIGSFGGTIQLGKLRANVELKRNSQTSPTNVVVVLEDGKKRVAFPSQGAAVKFLSNLSKIVNGN